MSSKLTTHYLTEEDYEGWNQLVSASPQGSIYCLPQYLSTLCEATGGRFKILTVCRGSEMVGGVSLYEESSPAGRFISPRLLLYYNGLVFRSYETKYPSQRTSRLLDVMDTLEGTISSSGYARVILKNHPSVTDARLFQSRGWEAAPTYTYVVPLTDMSALWERVEQNLRRFIHRCSGEGLVLSEDEDFDSFYQMHQQTVERKGTSLYLPHSNFKRYFDRLRGQDLCRLFQARLPNGRSIAAQLVLLGTQGCAHTVSAAAEREFLPMGANAFLRWKVFEVLAKMGYGANDLTDAALNPVTHFKSQLGGDLKVCLELRRPDSLAFRAYRGGRDMVERGHELLGAAARKMFPKRS